MDGITARQPRASQSYQTVNIYGHAKAHLGNVYNLEDADAKEWRVLDWLTPVNPSESHDKAWKQYQEGTLSWFFADARFLIWSSRLPRNYARALWCRGDMGAGKTTLVAQVLGHLQTKSSRGSLAVVYCRHLERNLQTAEYLLGSILAQLYQCDSQGFNIPSHVRRAFESQSRFLMRQPSLKQLVSWLGQRLDAGKRVFILVDAIDELNTSSRQALLRMLRSLPQESLRLLITSRVLPDIDKELPKNVNVQIRPSREDLERFTHLRIREANLASGSLRTVGLFFAMEERILSKILSADNT